MRCEDKADGIRRRDAELRLDISFPVFSAVVRTENGWELLGEPQRDPYAACMLMAAAIWMGEPAICLSELQTQAESAITVLRGGARKASIRDDMHRVERTDLIIDIPVCSPSEKR